MKIEFNEKGFFADINCSSTPTRDDELKNIGSFIKVNKPLFFALIAFAIALVNLSFGLVINLSGELISEIFDEVALHFLTVTVFLSAIMSVISVVCGVFSISGYSKSQGRSADKIGVLFAILSFIISAASLTLGVVGVFIW